MKLDPTPLANAVRRLREGLRRHEQDPADEQLRDGLIQRFEFAYELSHRMPRRYLKDSAASPDELERMAFADLVRTGNARGLLRRDWSAWRRFPEMRARLAEAFSDSDLPCKVDFLDWHGLDEGFRKIVAAERVPLCDPADSDSTIAGPK